MPLPLKKYENLIIKDIPEYLIIENTSYDKSATKHSLSNDKKSVKIEIISPTVEFEGIPVENDKKIVQISVQQLNLMTQTIFVNYKKTSLQNN